jgi:thiol-disulfide isomerase/thioredoxin
MLSAIVLTGTIIVGSTAMAAPNALVGTDAPIFQAPMLKNVKGKFVKKTSFDLQPYIGKKVIMLDFWSIYCVSCVQEMPKLIEIQKKYPDELLTVGVDLDSFGTKRVVKFLKQYEKKTKTKIPYPIVVDKRRKVAGQYSVSVLPTTIIIDKSGKIVYYHVGYKPGDEKEIEAKIREAAGL